MKLSGSLLTDLPAEEFVHLDEIDRILQVGVKSLSTAKKDQKELKKTLKKQEVHRTKMKLEPLEIS